MTLIRIPFSKMYHQNLLIRFDSKGALVNINRWDSWHAVAYLGPCQLSAMELFCKNHLQLKPLTKSSQQRCSVKKGVLRNFAKFTGKHLCQSLFFNKVAGGGRLLLTPTPPDDCFWLSIFLKKLHLLNRILNMPVLNYTRGSFI